MPRSSMRDFASKRSDLLRRQLGIKTAQEQLAEDFDLAQKTEKGLKAEAQAKKEAQRGHSLFEGETCEA